MLIKDVINKIKEQEEIAAFEPDPYSPAYPAQQANRRNALVAIKDLKDQYKEVLVGSTLLMVATGKNLEELAEISSNLGTYTASLDAPIDLAVENTNSELFIGKQLNQEPLSFTIDVIENVVANAGVLGLSLDYTNNQPYIKNIEEYSEIVAGKLAGDDGAVALFLTAMDGLAKKASQDGFDQKIFPVLLTTKYPFLAESLFKALSGSKTVPFKPSLIVSSSKISLPGAVSIKEVSEDSVRDAFLEVKERIFGKSNEVKKGSKTKNKTITDTTDVETVEQGE